MHFVFLVSRKYPLFDCVWHGTSAREAREEEAAYRDDIESEGDVFGQAVVRVEASTLEEAEALIARVLESRN